MIILLEVIEHIEDFQNAMKEIKKILKPDGILIISTPNFSYFVYRILYLIGFTPTNLGEIDKRLPILKRKSIDTNLHINHYNHTRLRRLLKHYKFEIIKDLSLIFSWRKPHKFIRLKIFNNLLTNRIIYITKLK